MRSPERASYGASPIKDHRLISGAKNVNNNLVSEELAGLNIRALNTLGPIWVN